MSVIEITQGDDSNAFDAQILIKLETELDLTGCRAVFQLGDFQQCFDDISGKELALVIPAAATKGLACGACCGGLKIYDQNGRAKTICKDIKFLVQKGVVSDE